MIVVVSVLMVVAILAVGWTLVVMARRLLRWAAADSPQVDARQSESAIPFGSLPPLGPVGQLGGLSPEADIDSDGTNEHNLYGY